MMEPNLTEIAYRCARPVRGCATDEQFTDVTGRIEKALHDARTEGAADALRNLAGAMKKVFPDISEQIVARYNKSRHDAEVAAQLVHVAALLGALRGNG